MYYDEILFDNSIDDGVIMDIMHVCRKYEIRVDEIVEKLRDRFVSIVDRMIDDRTFRRLPDSYSNHDNASVQRNYLAELIKDNCVLYKFQTDICDERGTLGKSKSKTLNYYIVIPSMFMRHINFDYSPEFQKLSSNDIGFRKGDTSCDFKLYAIPLHLGLVILHEY